MWIVLNDAFLSIVAHRYEPDKLLVRARLEGDIEKAFPDVEVDVTPDADYLFRAVIDRAAVVSMLASRLSSLQYTNFKASVFDRTRHDLYLKIWKIMRLAQHMFSFPH